MTTVKLTITLPDTQIDEIRKRVAALESPSISGFVQLAVHKILANSSEFSAMVDQGLMETGGPLTPKERAWVRKMLSPQERRTRTAKPRKAAREASRSMPAASSRSSETIAASLPHKDGLGRR